MLLYKGSYTLRVYQYTSKEAMFVYSEEHDTWYVGVVGKVVLGKLQVNCGDVVWQSFTVAGQ